ncbi:MAG: outer membrane beta-barrel protein [Desulfobacterales bacterium]|nr:outer membrane beta-barrel protein [Desulfobacterales bacterium]
MLKSFYHSALILLLLTGLIFPAAADAAMKKTLTPKISIQEQYDDNIDLEAEDEDSDWITLVSPGISLELESPDTTMALDYEAGFSFYRDDSSRDSTRHKGRADWDQRLTRHLRFQATDTFIRTEEPILETDERVEIVQRQRNIYRRNTGQVSFSYEFGEEDRLTAGYRNRYFDDMSPSDEDSQGHEGFLNLDAWFTPQYGIGLTSRCNRGQFEQRDDFDQYAAGLTANYRWQPSRRFYARYDFLYHDFEDPGQRNDHRVHQGALGVSLAFGNHTNFDVEGGYFLQDYLNGSRMDGATFKIGLLTRGQRASLRLAGSGGYEQDYFSSENLGSSKYRRAFGSAGYLLTENLRIFASASYSRQEFFGADIEVDRKDELWRGSGGFSLSFLRRLQLSLEATHSERDSDEPAAEFEDNRVTLRLTGAYPFQI